MCQWVTNILTAFMRMCFLNTPPPYKDDRHATTCHAKRASCKHVQAIATVIHAKTFWVSIIDSN